MADTFTTEADGSVSRSTSVILTPAEADRVLKIQDTLIASVRAATEAHKAGVSRIAQLEDDKAALSARVAELEADRDRKAPMLVDPAAMQPLLDDLAGAVAATHAAVAPHAAPDTAPQPEAEAEQGAAAPQG